MRKEGGSMNNEVKTLKKSFVMAILSLLLLLVIATGATYAWFTFTGITSTNVTPMGGTVGSGDTVLLIANAEGGPFDKTCQLKLTADPDALRPVSTADLEHFYRVTAQNKEGIAMLYESADRQVSESVLYGTVYLQCKNAPCDVYFNKKELKLGSDPQALAAMRLGLVITSKSGKETFIFKLDDLGSTGSATSVKTVPRSLAVVSSISGGGTANYVDDPAKELGGYMAVAGEHENEYNPGASKLVSLEADEVATVSYYLYLEGCDEQCSNAVQNKSSEIQLAFAGVDTTGEQKGERG